MTRKDEIRDPNSCLNKAADGELVFVLREKDAAGAAAIRAWAEERFRLGLNAHDDDKITEAYRIADAWENGPYRTISPGCMIS